MVFPGRLSKGCHVCRRRKVKCDGAKPECQRCIKHGIRCTGYPDAFSFREYRPTETAAESPIPAQRSGVAGSHLRIFRTDLSHYAHSRSDTSQAVFSASGLHRQAEPSRALSVCTDWQSLCNFMNHVVLKVHRSPCEGHLAFLPDFFQEKGDDPCLKHALLSVSYLTLSNVSGAPDLHIKARLNYGQSLEHLNMALSSRDRALKDEILVACLLLSIFFNSVNEGGGLPNPHMSGISHLLQLRGNEQAASKYNRYLIGWIITQIHIQAIGTNQFQYVKIPRFMETMPNPDCVLRAGILNSMISRFCESASDMWSLPSHAIPGSDSTKESVLRNLIKRIPCLMEEIEAWNASIPPHWKRQYHLDNFIVAPDSAGPSPDPWTITFLAITHSAQIVFYSHALSCCEEIQRYDPEFVILDSSNSIIEFCGIIEARIPALLKIICYSVSSIIGFLDGDGVFQPMTTAKFANSNTLLWPMWAAVTCPFATRDQVSLCRSALSFIGQAMGHKLAFSLSTQATSLPNTRLL